MPCDATLLICLPGFCAKQMQFKYILIGSIWLTLPRSSTQGSSPRANCAPSMVLLQAALDRSRSASPSRGRRDSREDISDAIDQSLTGTAHNT
eukprot:scaffold269545_cov14-Tisochrysis_lutea.AAC.1